MPMATLDAIRTGKLNVELGLTADSDDRFGTTAERNYALQEALRRLWPRMARLTRESVSLVTDQYDYTLSTIRDVAKVEQLDATGHPVSDLSGDYRAWYDEEDATPVVRLLLTRPLPSTDTLRVIGYAPYIVPASSPPSSSGSVDLQPDDEWIIIAGARAMLFRRLFNSFVVYERHENENRKTFLTPDQLIGIANDAERMFQQGIASRPRRMVVGTRARPGR
jgi:hypothetical protein